MHVPLGDEYSSDSHARQGSIDLVDVYDGDVGLMIF